MSLLLIAGGHVVDPRNGVDGPADVWARDGAIVVAPEDPGTRPDRRIDARGYIVMPGGVDMHSHVVGSKVNAARLMRPEEARADRGFRRIGTIPSGVVGGLPTTSSTGARYAGLGYTTAFDAAVAPLAARQAHLEFEDVPIIDKGFLVLMGNNHYVLERAADGDSERLRAYLLWMLRATGAFGIKAVNPGGVERWKQGRGGLASLDDAVDGFGVTPRSILEALASAADEVGLPHPVHVHGLNLGTPGNAEITLETMRAVEGRRAHFAHIQFHSYGGDSARQERMSSKVEPLADFVNEHSGISVDVGQILFGETTSMTADAAVGDFLRRVTGRKWYSHDVENETGCGVVPITYDDKNAIHALQWTIGLEWFLRVDDPWKIALSTDHPNGGSFLSYPRIISWLMDRERREDLLKTLPEKARAKSSLGELDREYDLSEIAVITRAAPARLLGLDRKGHLGPGADADVTIYAPNVDRELMFSLPRYVVKAGEIILDDGDFRSTPLGSTLIAETEVAPETEAEVEAWFNDRYSLRYRNFILGEHEVVNPRAVGRSVTSRGPDR